MHYEINISAILFGNVKYLCHDRFILCHKSDDGLFIVTRNWGYKHLLLLSIRACF